MNRVRKLKTILWMLLGLAASVAALRFSQGMGSSSNLSDANPWGVWVGFDVMGGVALAAGGFILTATVYIFKLERYHDVVRPAVLTAFLGYAAVAVGLLFDLGLPWNIWHMIVFWNPHSPLFEVGWCVMLYLTVLTLEFFPVPAEEFPRLHQIRSVLIKLRLPLVLVGIGLSCLHQSSLGSLFLIMPYRLYPLWYSPILPILFLNSAIGLGLSMVIFESHTTAFLYRRKPETEVLAGLGSASRWVLGLYLIVRFTDLIVRGQAGYLFAPNWRTGWFWLEVLIMAVIPIILFSIRDVRYNRAGQWAAAAIAVFGVVLNRLDVGGIAHPRPDGTFYTPSWMEISISLGVVSAATLVFLFMIEHFKVWEERPADPEADPKKLPEFDPVGTTWLGVPAVAARTSYSLAFILTAAVGFAIVKPQPIDNRGLMHTPVHQARGGDILWIDGNLDGFGVEFKHAEEVKRNGEKQSCVKCHHMNLPHDEASTCNKCHTDMYRTVDAFKHDWHASPTGAGIACYQCHAKGQVRTAATAAKCDKCHKNLIPQGSPIELKKVDEKNYQAVSYTEAMHRLCIDCHIKQAKATNKPEIARCGECHKDRREIIDSKELVLRRAGLGDNLVLPPSDIVRESDIKEAGK